MSKQEKVAIVDKNNSVLGYVPRKDLTDDHTWRIISVWIENNEGQVLLQQRSHNKSHAGGKWTCAVEGTVEGDDWYEDTAKREVSEEIGLENFDLLPAKQLYYKTSHGARIAQGYQITCDWPIEKFVIQKSEVAQLKWVDRKTVINEIKAGDPKYPKSAKIWLEMFDLV